MSQRMREEEIKRSAPGRETSDADPRQRSTNGRLIIGAGGAAVSLPRASIRLRGLLCYRRQLVFISLMLGALLLYVAALDLFQIGTYIDDADYVVLARSIAAGQGYVLGTILGHPPETRQPPGFPLLLSGIAFLFPRNLSPFRLPSLFLTIGSLPIWLVVLKQRLSYTSLLLLFGATITNGQIIGFATNVMAEAPVLFLLPLLFLLVEDLVDPNSNRASIQTVGRISAVILILTGLHLLRSVMIVLLPVTVGYLLMKRRVKIAIVVGVLVLTPFAGWMFYSRSPHLSGNSVTGMSVSTYQLSLVGVNDTPRPTQPPLDQMATLLRPRWVLLSVLFPSSLSLNLVSPDQPRLLTRLLLSTNLPWLPGVVSLIVPLTVLLGLLQQVRRNRSFVEISTICYMAALFLWPYPATRFFHPYTPLLYLYLASGVTLLLDWLRVATFRRKLNRWITVAVLVGLCLMNLRIDAENIVYPPRSYIPDLKLGATWIAEYTPARAVVMSDLAVQRSLYTQREMAALPSTDDDPTYLSTLQRLHVDYVMVAPSLRSTWMDPAYSPQVEELRRKIASHPHWFQLVYTNPEKHVQVYHFTEQIPSSSL